MAGHTNLKEHAYLSLLEELLAGKLRPGDILDRRGVARRLGMSPAPVHEAMLQLQYEGLLEALPRRGTLVKPIGREEVRGHLVLREAFERQASRLVGNDVWLSEAERLRELAALVDSATTEDWERARAEVEFHVQLVALAQCPALTGEYRRIMRVGLFYRVSMLLPMPARHLRDSHCALVERLLSAPAEAGEILAEHLWSGKPEFLSRQSEANNIHA